MKHVEYGKEASTALFKKDRLAGKTITSLDNRYQLKFTNDGKIETYFKSNNKFAIRTVASYSLKPGKICTQTEKIAMGKDSDLFTKEEYKLIALQQVNDEDYVDSMLDILFGYLEYTYVLEDDNQITFMGTMFEDVKQYLTAYIETGSIGAWNSYIYSENGEELRIEGDFFTPNFGSSKVDRNTWIAQKATDTDITYILTDQAMNIIDTITIPYSYDSNNDTFTIQYDGKSYTLECSLNYMTGRITEN